MFAETVAETTQVRAPGKAVWRTYLAMIPTIALLIPVVLAAIANGDGSILGAWAVTAIAVSGAITRVLALPGVEAFLREHAPFLSAGAQK